jgi:methyltransferase
MVTRWIFTVFLALLGLQRIFELRLSNRHENKLIEKGAKLYGVAQFKVMKAMHFSWFLAMLFEVFHFQRPFIPRLAKLAAILFMAGQALRYSAIRTLRQRWTASVCVLPAPPVKQGIYRYIRHPNYLGVILEIVAVPLLHSAYWTAAVFSLFNAALLQARIRLEERALSDLCNYQSLFREQPKLFPKLNLYK